MTRNSCPCCGSVTEHTVATDSTPIDWQTGNSILTTNLPEELGSALGRFLGTEPVETFGGWAAAVRDHIGGGDITINELCVTDDETPHWGIVNDNKYYFACFYDAVILAALEETPVDIRTQSPDGTIIEARAVGTDELTVHPAEAVFSFGIEKDVTPPSEEGPSLERGYATICPYVKAFQNREAYDQWASSVHAETIDMPLADATGLAAALVD